MRAEVRHFASAMESKLRDNDHKSHWSACSPRWLLNRLRQETRELERAVRTGDAEKLLREAADVANFAMMVADVVARDANEEPSRGE